jgi:hypothetical protein
MLLKNDSCCRKNWVTLGPASQGFFPEGERPIYFFSSQSIGLCAVHSRSALLLQLQTSLTMQAQDSEFREEPLVQFPQATTARGEQKLPIWV